MSLLHDALAVADIRSLLREAAETIATAYSADHVLVLELGAISSESCFCSSVGWEQPAALRLGKQLLEQTQQPKPDDLEECAQGGIYLPTPEFLHKQGLCAGLFVSLSCDSGKLALFTGDARDGTSLSNILHQRSLHAIGTMLSLMIRQESAELVHSAKLEKVIEAKRQWEATLDALPQLVCLIDEQVLVIRANRTLETWQLGNVTTIRGTPIHDMLHPECRDSECDLNARLRSMCRQLGDTDFSETTIDDLVPDSALYLSMYRCRGSHYEERTTEQGYAFLLIEKIGQRKRIERLLAAYNKQLEKQLAEQSTQLRSANARLEHEVQAHLRDKMVLRDSEQRYACFVENTLTGIFVIRNNRISYYNQRFAEIFGYKGDEIYQLELKELFPGDKQLTKSGQMAADSLLQGEAIVEGKTRAGATIWLRRSLNAIECMRETKLLGNVVDVTAQENAEDALRASERELRSLSDKLLLSQEAERKRVALELHDGIGQSLSAIKFSAENALRDWEDRNQQQSRQYLERFVDSLRGAIEEVRSIAMGLRPSMLDDLGLVTTLGWLCREFQVLNSKRRIETQFAVDESKVPETLKIVVFRIVQEALNNIEKHAMATGVSVELERSGDSLRLCIRDNGCGITPADIQVASGLGLGSMKERAQLSSATFSIDSKPDKGTAILVVWSGLQERVND